MDNTRITRIPLPIDLIRRIDEAVVGGVGGYGSRTELIVDAILERLLELAHDEAPPVTAVQSMAESSDKVIDAAPIQSPNSALPSGPDSLSLDGIEPPTLISPDRDISQPEGAPLFGLHNRDYPSLWALRELAAMCTLGPVPLDEFWRIILPKAWEQGETLLTYQNLTGVKTTALFPTNRAKMKPAETGFSVFAVGKIGEIDANGVVATAGPLFEWRAAGLLMGTDSELLVGPTSAGWDLLRSCAAVSVLEPHPANIAGGFLAHLAEYAPADRAAFDVILSILATRVADRGALLAQVAETWPTWSDSQVSTNSTGYVARAREWGFVEPKQIDGCYQLTDFGQQFEVNNKSKGKKI